MNCRPCPDLRGLCFQFALDFARKHMSKGRDESKDPVVVHGKVQKPLDRKWMDHAWVEFRGKVYDNVFTKGVDPVEYKRLFHPKALARYSAVQALVQAVRNRHFGPWETK